MSVEMIMITAKDNCRDLLMDIYSTRPENVRSGNIVFFKMSVNLSLRENDCSR